MTLMDIISVIFHNLAVVTHQIKTNARLQRRVAVPHLPVAHDAHTTIYDINTTATGGYNVS